MSDFTTNSPVAVCRPTVAVEAGTRIIRNSLYEELVSLADAWESARTAISAAHEEADTIRESYRQEGLEEGRQDAQKIAIEQVAQMQGSMSDWVKNTDSQLIELVNRCVGEVVNKIDPTLLVTQSVEKGLAELASAQQIIVRVHPDTAGMEQTISDLTQRYGITGSVRLVQDGTLSPGDAIVESPVGTVDLRLANQLKLISKALKS
jgi:flagellar biosynthesis/type III secretory pathway protein FliH